MNYNITAYIIYLAVMVFIIVYVGKYFYKNGRIFILSLLNDNVTLADHINRLLLVGYYLLNIGYAFIKLNYWQRIRNVEMLVSTLAANIGTLIFILALIHYLNMLTIYFLSKSKLFSITNKTFHV